MCETSNCAFVESSCRGMWKDYLLGLLIPGRQISDEKHKTAQDSDLKPLVLCLGVIQINTAGSDLKICIFLPCSPQKALPQGSRPLKNSGGGASNMTYHKDHIHRPPPASLDWGAGFAPLAISVAAPMPQANRQGLLPRSLPNAKPQQPQQAPQQMAMPASLDAGNGAPASTATQTQGNKLLGMFTGAAHGSGGSTSSSGGGGQPHAAVPSAPPMPSAPPPAPPALPMQPTFSVGAGQQRAAPPASATAPTSNDGSAASGNAHACGHSVSSSSANNSTSLERLEQSMLAQADAESENARVQGCEVQGAVKQ